MRKVEVKVGDITIGGNQRPIVQTMCNTATQDIESSFNQCVRLYEKGAEIIRLTTQGTKEVEALRIIKSRLRDNGIFVPLVADVHFSSDVALAAARVADKVRINPGNFAKDFNIASKKFSELTDVCKEEGTALRIGINHGSLGERIVEKYGDTPLGMVNAALEWIKMSKDNNFDQIVLSLKSSNTRVMVEAYRMLYQEMTANGEVFPLHLGVTEAGNGEAGRVKSAVGISTLLSAGIGDTIRVSLTEDPANEIPVALFIADYFYKRQNKVYHKSLISKQDDGTLLCNSIFNCQNWDEFIMTASCELGPPLLDKIIDDVKIELNCPEHFTMDDLKRFRDNLLQASRRKFSSPEYIACPGCGRTLFNLENVFNEVKRRTSHLVGYNIAVMGCIVNGPGEMSDADYGYVGEGKNKVTIYRGKEPVYRSVPEDSAIDMLLELIEEDARNKVFLPRT
ncbi:MAG: (E)-4-hydroxy-3-methylbut-2-enyl-diphosphate synthase [Rikenellaceae bacterium]|nr:(E)-4-hydroxy-3-methylbut-2-enyl-diphosphate synthase [Rikenellaceae bacterium]